MLTNPWRIEMFGHLRARQGEQTLDRFPTHKTGALLAFLAYHLDSQHSRERLVGLFWPDAGPGAGQASLSTALGALRRRLEPPATTSPRSVLVTDRLSVRLNPEAVSTDVGEFQAIYRQIGEARGGEPRTDLLIRAAALCQGELLPEYYQDWVSDERRLRQEQLRTVLDRLVRDLLAASAPQGAIPFAQRMVGLNPFDENAHAHLIRLYRLSGRAADARLQYEVLQERLEETGERPAAETELLLRTPALQPEGRAKDHGKQTDPGLSRPACVAESEAEGEKEPVDPGTKPGHGVRLPLRLTRFFGREDETAAVGNLLRAPDVRLVTITGLGGSGKTRLSVEAGRRLQPFFRGGVTFVPVADLTGQDQILAAILRGLGLPPSGAGDGLARIVRNLGDTPHLLILDGVEHLLTDGTAVVLALLGRAVALRVLVTSRHNLRIDGERTFPLPTLPVPPTPRGGPSLAEINGFASVELFVDRAQSVRPDFQLTARNAAAVAGLCRDLDGIPLALELAAAWSQTLTPAQMRGQLSRRFEFLVSRPQGRYSLHPSMEAVLLWTYGSLSPPVQGLLRRLSVFRGGWSAEAATHVCGTTGQDVSQTAEMLGQLRGRSLVTAEEAEQDGALQMRFGMLDTIREFAAERTGEGDSPEEWAAVSRRHAEYYSRLAETARPFLIGAEQAGWLGRLEAEHTNLQTALRWFEEGGENGSGHDSLDAGLRMAAALWRFWDVHGHFTVAREHYDALLSLPFAAGRTKARANALLAAGGMNLRQGLRGAAKARWEESLSINRDIGDRLGVANCLGNLAKVADEEGDARAATDLHAQSLQILKELGEKYEIAVELLDLGNMAYGRGSTAEAEERWRESLEWFRAVPDEKGAATVLGNLGTASKDQGLYSEGYAFQAESLRLRQKMRDAEGIALALEEFGDLACLGGYYWRAARLYGAMDRLREDLQAPSPPLAQFLGPVRAALGEAGLASAWGEGRSMTVEQAIRYALEGADAPAEETGH